MALNAPQLFAKYNIKVFRSITAYLQNTNANSAFNKRLVKFSAKDSHVVNGYVGVESPNSSKLIVAFTW